MTEQDDAEAKAQRAQDMAARIITAIGDEGADVIALGLGCAIGCFAASEPKLSPIWFFQRILQVATQITSSKKVRATIHPSSTTLN